MLKFQLNKKITSFFSVTSLNGNRVQESCRNCVMLCNVEDENFNKCHLIKVMTKFSLGKQSAITLFFILKIPCHRKITSCNQAVN